MSETAAEIVGAVKELLERTLRPFHERLKSIESKAANAEKILEDWPSVARKTELEEAIKAIPSGPPGPPGDSVKGEKGDPGESIRGESGKDGTLFLSGDGPPIFGGKAGDIYLDTNTGQLYRCD